MTKSPTVVRDLVLSLAGRADDLLRRAGPSVDQARSQLQNLMAACNVALETEKAKGTLTKQDYEPVDVAARAVVAANKDLYRDIFPDQVRRPTA